MDDRGVVASSFWAHSVESELVPELSGWISVIVIGDAGINEAVFALVQGKRLLLSLELFLP